MIEKLPSDIFSHVLSHTHTNDIAAISRASKKLYDMTAPTLRGLREIYISLTDKKANEITDACLNSLKVTQAVMMSKLLFKLNGEQIIAIACTSYDHAKVILKSHFIQRRIRHNNDAPIKSSGHVSKATILEDQIESIEKISQLTYEDILSNFEAMNITISANDMQRMFIEQDFYEKCKPMDIIERIAKKDPQYACLVLIHVGEKLNSYRLMELAKLSLEHAKLVLGSVTLRNRLKQGHVIGIGRESLEHAKYIFDHHLTLIGLEGVQQLGAISAEYSNMIANSLVATLSTLPIRMVKAKFELIKPVTIMLLNNSFYGPSNSFWEGFKNKNIEGAKQIAEAFKVVTSLRQNNKINTYIVIKIMKLSINCAKEILSLPNVEKKLDLTELKRLAFINEEYATLINNFIDKNTSHVSAKTYRL